MRSNKKGYIRAIEIAADAEERFLKAMEEHRAYADDRALSEKHHQIAVQPAATEACAQQSLIAELFGVSEEKVHEDITQLLTDR